jgi:hypothetical protein
MEREEKKLRKKVLKEAPRIGRTANWGRFREIIAEIEHFYKERETHLREMGTKAEYELFKAKKLLLENPLNDNPLVQRKLRTDLKILGVLVVSAVCLEFTAGYLTVEGLSFLQRFFTVILVLGAANVGLFALLHLIVYPYFQETGRQEAIRKTQLFLGIPAGICMLLGIVMNAVGRVLSFADTIFGNGNFSERGNMLFIAGLACILVGSPILFAIITDIFYKKWRSYKCYNGYLVSIEKNRWIILKCKDELAGLKRRRKDLLRDFVCIVRYNLRGTEIPEDVQELMREILSSCKNNHGSSNLSGEEDDDDFPPREAA